MCFSVYKGNNRGAKALVRLIHRRRNNVKCIFYLHSGLQPIWSNLSPFNVNCNKLYWNFIRWQVSPKVYFVKIIHQAFQVTPNDSSVIHSSHLNFTIKSNIYLFMSFLFKHVLMIRSVNTKNQVYTSTMFCMFVCCLHYYHFISKLQKYYGTLEAVGTRESIIRDIIARRNVRYKIRFPLQNPLPRISSIIYDSKIICTGLQGMSCIFEH